MLLPAPVELPLSAGAHREPAVRPSGGHRRRQDQIRGDGRDGRPPPRPVRRRPDRRHPTVHPLVREPMVIRAVAGHMHLLGRSITIDVDKGTLQAKRILDVPVYDFDDGARAR